ncbi:MAG: LuxR C-terminal-related transcriptional regulator [Chloroflexota bacterium]|nr:LuxR C-terminal-related transcriptional regulator [Chloroflexota bacterium]
MGMGEGQASRDFGESSDREPWDCPRPVVLRDAASFSTHEAAGALGVSERTVRRAIARGALAATRDGWSYRVARAALDRYAATMSRTAAPRPTARVVAFPGAIHAWRLPEPLSSLVGRDAEVARLVALLDDPAVRLLTLTGPGGIGKTRLALAVAAVAADRFPDGAAFVALDAVHRAELVVPTIAQALRLRERSGQGRAEQLAAFLHGKRLLLVLDNFEQVLAAGPAVAALLAQVGAVTALVTSRAPLRVDGEQEMPVPPLALAGAGSSPREMLGTAAVRLFVERARAHAPAVPLDEASAPLIADVCARLDGLPLAIELAAARIKVHPPRQLHALLERRLPLLTRGASDAPPRHGTMRDAIAWSYDLLLPTEQRLFRRLAVFAGGFMLDAAEAVTKRGEGETSPSSVLDSVENLIDQSLLDGYLGPDGDSRFRMLETIREFGLERLASAGEEADARALHARYFLALARALRPWVTVHARQAPLDRLAAEAANLQASLIWLEARGPAEAFAELAAALSEWWISLSLFRDGQSWLERALGSIDRAAAPDRARLLTGYAGMLIGQGRFDQAEPVLARALPLSRAAGDPLDTAWTLILRGAMLNGGGTYPEAEVPLHEAIALADRIGDPALAAAVAGRALANLSVSARGQGAGARATDASERAIRLYAGHGLDLAESISRMDLGASAFQVGDYALAARRWREGLALTGERGDVRQIADALSGIACVAATWGVHQPALLLFGTAEALRERVGAAMLWPSDVAAAGRGLAALRNAVGEPAAASTLAKGRAFSLAEAMALAATVTRPEANAGAATQASGGLTRRETEILLLLAARQSDREIAEALFLSPRTVQWHVRSILAKLEATSRREAVTRAQASGLL